MSVFTKIFNEIVAMPKGHQKPYKSVQEWNGSFYSIRDFLIKSDELSGYISIIEDTDDEIRIERI